MRSTLTDGNFMNNATITENVLHTIQSDRDVPGFEAGCFSGQLWHWARVFWWRLQAPWGAQTRWDGHQQSRVCLSCAPSPHCSVFPLTACVQQTCRPWWWVLDILILESVDALAKPRFSSIPMMSWNSGKKEKRFNEMEIIHYGSLTFAETAVQRPSCSIGLSGAYAATRPM